MVPVIRSVPLSHVLPFINWTYFFHAWHLVGNYDGLTSLCSCDACRKAWLLRFSSEERPKAEEALRLYGDAQQQLKEWLKSSELSIRVKYAFFDAQSHGQVITLSHQGHHLHIPTLRQQRPRPDGTCWALADFVSPHNDKVGLFAVAVHCTSTCDDTDTYALLLQRTLADRLAEATSEYLQQSLLRQHAIRPAFGYPSLPDVSLLFDVNRFFPLSDIGISLTPHAAMLPTSSICGLYIQHPHVRYFLVGDISREQLHWYARQRNLSPEMLTSFLNLTILS